MRVAPQAGGYTPSTAKTIFNLITPSYLLISEVLRSLTSIYQLLPIDKVININGEYHRIAEADNLPDVDKLKAQDALAFHREIEAAVSRISKTNAFQPLFTIYTHPSVPSIGIRCYNEYAS